MYIPEFFCGVLATIGLEMVILICYSVYVYKKGRKANEAAKKIN